MPSRAARPRHRSSAVQDGGAGFATASPPRDDIHPPSDAFYKDMYALAHDWCGSQIAAPVNQAVKVLRAALVSSPEKVIHSSKSMTLVDLYEQTDPSTTAS